MKDDKLWTVFSIYIRLRDIVPGTEGYIRCITSARLVHWKESDAGHFISRRYLATKFHEQNVNAQSRNANRFNSGEQFAYSKAVDKKYGSGTADKLLALSRSPSKRFQFEIDTMILHYTEQVKLLKAKNHIK